MATMAARGVAAIALVALLVVGTATADVRHGAAAFLEAPMSPALISWLDRTDTPYKLMDGVVQFVYRGDLNALEAADANLFGARVLERAQPLTSKMPDQLASYKRGDLLPTGYLDLADIHAFLEDMAATYPTLAAVVDSTVYGPGKTYEGRALPLLKISGNVTEEEDEPAILINGMHHAREIVTPVVAMDIVSRLLQGYTNDADIRTLVDSNAIYVLPVVNPDGYEYVWTSDNMWRKNRKRNSGGSYGVDLNRNYDLGWDNSCSGSTVPASETYKGTSAASEEETQIVVDFSLRHNIAKMLDFHSYGREVLVAYLCEPMPAAFDKYISDEGARLGALANYGTRPPSADGEHQEWTIARVTSYAYLAETATTFQPPYADAVAEAARVWPLVRAFLEQPAPLTGHVTVNGAPAAAAILVNDWDVEWHSDELFGRYHIFLPDGSHNVTFVAPGGADSVSHIVSIDNDRPQVLDIAL